MPSITLFAPLNTYSCFGLSVCEVFASLRRHGWEVSVKPLTVSEECNGQKFTIPMEITEAVDSAKETNIELLMAPVSALAMPTPGRVTVYWPLLDTPVTPKEAAIISLAELVIVGSETSESALIQANISVPMATVRRSVPGGIFVPTPIIKAGRCIIGTGGAPITPKSRRMVEPIIEAFKLAFDGISDAELRVYLPFVPIESQSDTRIKVETTWKPNLHLCRWYQGLHAYASADIEEGDVTLQAAMSCGRPVIGYDYAEITQYPTPPDTQNTLIQQMAGQMRRVYIDRQECEKLGGAAAAQIKPWDGEALNTLLRGLL